MTAYNDPLSVVSGSRPLSGRVDSVPRELWQEAIAAIYERMRKAAERGPYQLTWKGNSLTVLPNVYAPQFFTDSFWFADELPSLIDSHSLLEIGTGTGLIAMACAKNGAKVVATDINPEAVRNARLNVLATKLDVSVRQGDLYRPIEESERFDYIFWAHPFNNWAQRVEDMLLRSGRDYNYEGVRAYIEQASGHLAVGGKLLLGTGDSADLAEIDQIATANGYKTKVLRRAVLPLEYNGNLLVEYMILEFQRAH